MPDTSDALLWVVKGWVEKAENDLKNATHTLELGEEGPIDTVCFHAQQCVEKYLKALLVLRGIEFRQRVRQSARQNLPEAVSSD